MNNILKLLLFLTPIITYSQDVWVEGYYKNNGNYVEGHYRTSPNNTNSDNYSTEGNTNPYTDEEGFLESDNGVPYQDIEYEDDYVEYNHTPSKVTNYDNNNTLKQTSFYSIPSQYLENNIDDDKIANNQQITFDYIISITFIFMFFIYILYFLIRGYCAIFR